jgi:rfaE bifunctional protein kinase chain/domain
MTEESRALLEIVDKLSHVRIAVWGDIILDEYLYGKTRRISREAPVLILSYQKRELSLGGAGNALLNLRALGIEAVPIGVVGADEAGRAVVRILEDHGISTRTLVTAAGFSTPRKTRILAGEENTRKQQILRIDYEGPVPETAVVRTKLRKALDKAAGTCDALLVSDYHYRTVKEDIFRSVLPGYKNAGRPVTLDSRYRLLSFKGVTIATPNEPEVEEALQVHGLEEPRMLAAAGERLLAALRSPALLITRGSRGMALFQKGRRPLLLPIHGPADIVDVTGAGDTVISVFTAALAAGATYPQAARLANFAGGIVVMKKGTATVGPAELKQAIVSEH